MDEDCLVTDEATEERVIQFIELSPSDQSTAIALLQQFKGLRKVCNECDGRGRTLHLDPMTPGVARNSCPKCHGTGSIPVGPEDVNITQIVQSLRDYMAECEIPECPICARIDLALNGLCIAKDVEVGVK